MKERGKEKILTPHISPIGEMGAQRFLFQMGHYRAGAQVKFQTPKFYVGWGRSV